MNRLSQLTIAVLLAIVFLAWLHLASATSYMFNMLENGFSSFVDVASKIATVGTFMWAVFTLNGQRTAARESEAERLEEKIIGLLSSKDFKLHRSSARILIHYLGLMSSYSDTRALITTRPIIEEYLSALEIFNLLNIENSLDSIPDYSAALDCIKQSYENIKRNPKLDSRLVQRLRAGGNHLINPPEHCISLCQIVDLLAFVLNREESVVVSILESQPSALTDPHHRFPALFAYYYFFNTQNISLKSDGAVTVSQIILPQARNNAGTADWSDSIG